MVNKAPERGDLDNITLQDIERYRFASNYVNNKRVLDIACGTGYGSVLLLKEGKAKEVFGVDIDEKTILENRQFYRDLNNLFFVQGTAYALEFKDNYFDVVVSMETLEHLTDPLVFLKEIKRVTKPNGIIIISTPLNDTENRFTPSNPYHIREYNKEEFIELLNNYFKEYEFFFQYNILQRNWLTRINNKIFKLIPNAKIKLKAVLPERIIRTIRVVLKSERDKTIKSEIRKNQENAAVIIAVIKNIKTLIKNE